MARYLGPKVKLSRRVGVPIADIPKHTAKRQLTPPGPHGFRGRRLKDYGVRLVEKQKLRKKIAAHRPSILDLLTRINKNRDEKLLLDDIIFRKGRRLSIAGQAKDSAELAKFAESLAKQNGISEVRIQKQSFDDKQKILKFVTTFHYKNFTKKKK